LTGKMTTATIAEMEARYHWLLALGSEELARAAVSEQAPARSAAEWCFFATAVGGFLGLVSSQS
jgi:hypothetical protein